MMQGGTVAQYQPVLVCKISKDEHQFILLLLPNGHIQRTVLRPFYTSMLPRLRHFFFVLLVLLRGQDLGCFVITGARLVLLG